MFIDKVRINVTVSYTHLHDRHHVGGAVDERLHEAALGHAADDADDERHEQEPRGGLVEVPLAQRNAGKEARPSRSDLLLGDGDGLDGLEMCIRDRC